MKKIKRMLCPVCGEFIFETPNHDDIFWKERYEKGEAFCPSCGWIYDLDQIENPFLKEGFNKMSLNEYKEWYKNIKNKNPDYYYYDEFVQKSGPHKCPICGEYEFESEDSYDICPVCGWEDDGNLEEPMANDTSAEEAIRLFKEKRSKNPKYKWINDNN